MKQMWQRLAHRVDSRNIRERGLLFAVLVIIVIAVTNGLVFKSMIAQQHQLERQMQEDRKVVQTIQTEIEKMVTPASVDPDAENRAKLAKLKADADAADDAVRNLQQGLVSPDQIGKILENILEHQGKLKLISLKKLPLESLAASSSSTPPSGPATAAPESKVADRTPNKSTMSPGGPADSIYKHGVEITVRGQYFDILEYLIALEKMPNQVFWANAKLQVKEYPNATLTLDLFTLSLEKKWLSI
jgi:MSHA biogenesis protein MshJ